MIIKTRQGDIKYREKRARFFESYFRGASFSSIGELVSKRKIASLPTVYAAVSFAAEEVAKLSMCVWERNGAIRRKVTDVWQAKLFEKRPNPIQTYFTFWETIQASLDYRGNAYIWKTKEKNGRPIMLWALHPDQVTPKGITNDGLLVFEVTFGSGFITPIEMMGKNHAVVDSSVLHIRGRGGTGEIIAPSPIELFRASLGLAVAKQEYETMLYERGVFGRLVISFPHQITKQQAEIWRETFEAKHAGLENAGKTLVLGGGAEIKEIGMTQKDAQYIESQQLSVLDIMRIFRVPGFAIGVDPKYEKAESPEHQQDKWIRHGLTPRLARIESALASDPDLFGNTNLIPAFDTTDLLRADLATEAEISLKKIQSGQWLVDEARARDGLEPLPNNLGKIPQITPVGGAPNPNLGG